MIERAIESIRALIIDGDLLPGSRLPPEQELAAQLGSSRNTTREAVRALVAARVLDVRRGDGTYVTSLLPELLLDGIGLAVDLMQADSYLELVEVRRVLEPAITELAALRMSDADIDTLRRELELMRAAGSRHDQLIVHDAAFHDIVATGSGNAALASMLRGVSSRTLRARVWRGLVDADAHTRTVAEHELIFAAIHARDPVLARASATVHVSTTERSLRQLLQQDAEDDPATATVGPEGRGGQAVG
ncbi:MAG TPA: FadR/GntR family transcriptional regulator [Actinomycetales bacterium]|jgi:GntR family transcriptional repressor for pyruvate dehydrogenase complex